MLFRNNFCFHKNIHDENILNEICVIKSEIVVTCLEMSKEVVHISATHFFHNQLINTIIGCSIIHKI